MGTMLANAHPEMLRDYAYKIGEDLAERSVMNLINRMPGVLVEKLFKDKHLEAEDGTEN